MFYIVNAEINQFLNLAKPPNELRIDVAEKYGNLKPVFPYAIDSTLLPLGRNRSEHASACSPE